MDFYTVHILNCLNKGFGYFAWDDNGGFKTYDRQNRKWIEDVKDLLTNPAVSKDGCKANAWMQASGVTRQQITGGYCVGDISTGDYMNYKIDVPTTGNYTFEASVASPNAGGKIQIEKTGGSQKFGTVDVPNTGGWTTWKIVTTKVALTAGRVDLSIVAATGGFNLDFFRLTLDTVKVNVTGVSFAQQSLNLSLNNTLQLNAIVAPIDATNKSISWSSDNSSVASVDSMGLVTSKSIGKAVITAKTVKGGFEATITLDVVNQPITSLSLSPATLNLFANNTQQLTTTIEPADASNKTVKYSSNKMSIAKVDSSGLVTAMSPGTAIITATSADGGFKATTTITVKPALGLDLKIEAESHDQMLGITDETCSEGGQDVGYIDANDWMTYWNKTIPATGVYTVKFRIASTKTTGILRFEKAGTTTVFGEVPINVNTGGWQVWQTVTTTMTLPAGTYNLGISILAGGFNINWFEIIGEAKPYIAVASIAVIDTATVTANKTISLKPTISPIDASNKAIIWTSSNTAFATVDNNGVVTGKAAGVANISAMTEDGDFMATCVVTVKGVSTSLSELDNQQGITTYPNPTNGIITIEGLKEDILTIDVFDIIGNLQLQIKDCKSQNHIDLSGLTNGFYSVRITTNNGLVTQKIVKN